MGVTRVRYDLTAKPPPPQGLFTGDPESSRDWRVHSERAHAKLTYSETQGRGSNVKEAWVRPTCRCCRAFWRDN